MRNGIRLKSKESHMILTLKSPGNFSKEELEKLVLWRKDTKAGA